MIQFVTSTQVMQVNAENYTYPTYPNGLTKAIPSRVQVLAAYWFIPVTLGNRLLHYNELIATDATKPQADAFKVLRLKDAIDANTEYAIAVADADCVTTNSFVDKCNGCCGSTPVMADVTIPTPILQSPPQVTASLSNAFVFPFPANPNARLYSIPFPWFNGSAPATAYEPSGITTPAQFVTWANTSGKWDGFGTWTSTGDVVTLVSTSSDDIFVLLAGMQISLTAALFCFDLSSFSAGAAVNGLKLGSATTLSFLQLQLSNTNQDALISRLQPLMPGAVFTKSSNHLQVATVQATPHLYNNTSLVSTAGAGAC